MSTSRDDERLLDALLKEAREDPRPEDLKRLEQRLGAWLAPNAERMQPARATPPWRRALKPVLLAVSVGLVAQQFRDASPSGDFNARLEISSTPVPASARTTEVPAAAPVPEAGVSVADLPSVPEDPSGAKPSSNASPSPSASLTVAARPHPARVAPSSMPVVETKTAPADDTESEASFLRRTRTALDSDPARALRMTEEHASRFPRGVLAQERDVIAIDALVRLGAHDEARARARAFRARHPRSAHLSRLDMIVGVEGR